jgi:3-hydroxyacyl-CoA dehydrogenase
MAAINAVTSYDVLDGIAVITVDNPPVNALGQAVREGLLAAIEQAGQDVAVRAVVLACRGRTFFAGADITEFGKPPRHPDLGGVIAAFEACQKPTVAGIFGTALGGGLELAMGCRYRVAVNTARLGLPEVKLGILPGAGGTQRLPRLVGPEAAVAMIVSGTPIPARQALSAGLIDAVVEDATAGAVAFARDVLARGESIAPVSAREDRLAAARADATAFEAAASSALKRLKGIEAPAACVEAVRHSFTLPFAEGIAAERALFTTLVASDQSRAQRHVFFAEREAVKIPDMPAGVAAAPIKRAVVIGGGTMGGGIAMCFANAGVPVTVVETTEELLTKGMDRIRGTYQTSVERGGLDAATMGKRMGFLAGTTDWEVVRDADVVIEAVFENLDLKCEIFTRLDKLARPGALLATNTSTLDVDAIAAATARPGDVVGMHFFSPANVMKLLEIVRGAKTTHAALATALGVGKLLGKTAAVSGNCDGFIGNRMLARRTIEAERLLLEGAKPELVDAVVQRFGFPMGPYAMGDLAGLDVGWRIRQHRGATAPVSDALCEQGRFGQKTGAGYYLYKDGSRIPVPDPAVLALAEEKARDHQVRRREIGEGEILERMLYPMINEAARILEEGIAMRPSDIDIVWVYGYGWPAWRGGPCFYADLIGAGAICAALTKLFEQTGDDSMAPAGLLKEMAASGGSFADLPRKAAA